MNQVIKDILVGRKDTESKLNELNVLKEDIEVAMKVLDGTYKYCLDCDDYYLSKAFFTEVEDTATKICTFSDPINSSGDQYTDGILRTTYIICPKGHKHIKNECEKMC